MSSAATPLPNRRCPLCGGPNRCAPAASGCFGGPCWCTAATVSEQALQRVPVALRGLACLCPGCAGGAATHDDSLVLSVHDDPPAHVLSIIDAGLDAHNRSAAPLHDVRPLACVATQEGRRVIGGAVGRTWGRCAELQQLWVEPERRGQGLGARLVMAFEARVRERGCDTIYLDTFSFQAPSLYRDLGFEQRLAIEGFAPGIVKYTMVKRWAPA